MSATLVPYLHITDGTTDLNLLDGTNYSLERGTWAPRVAVRSRSTLGGRPYSEVIEEIPLIVRGATAAAAMANLGALSRLLDQAQSWYDDESEPAVIIKYQPHGSLLDAPLQSVIYGGAAEGGELVILPPDFNDVGMLYHIVGVVLRFVRDGAWYGPPEEVTEPGALESVDHPQIIEATFASSAKHYSPVAVDISPLPERADLPAYDTSFLLIANDPTRLQVLDASTMTGGVEFTTDADASHHPEGAGILIYTPTDTTEKSVSGVTLIGAGKRVGVIASLRNSTTTTTTFTVRVELSGGGGRSLASSRPYLVDASTDEPRIVSLGVVLCEEALYTTISLYMQASAAADTLEVDYLALIVMDDPTSRILAIGPIDLLKYVTIGEPTELRIDPRELTSRAPQVRHVGTNFTDLYYAIPDFWRGDAFLLSNGTTIAALYCGRSAATGEWRAYDTGEANVINGAFTFHRRPVYLVPE